MTTVPNMTEDAAADFVPSSYPLVLGFHAVLTPALCTVVSLLKLLLNQDSAKGDAMECTRKHILFLVLLMCSFCNNSVVCISCSAYPKLQRIGNTHTMSHIL